MVGVSKHQVSLNMNYSMVKISQNLLPPDSSILEWRWSRCKSWNSTPGVDPCLLSYANKSGESFEFKRGESPKQSLLILLFGPTITGCWKLKTTAALFCVLVITLSFNFSILLLRRWNNGKRLFSSVSWFSSKMPHRLPPAIVWEGEFAKMLAFYITTNDELKPFGKVCLEGFCCWWGELNMV